MVHYTRSPHYKPYKTASRTKRMKVVLKTYRTVAKNAQYQEEAEVL